MKIIDVITKRGDTLCGCLYGENYRDTCVIITNGTAGNIFENKFLRVVGEELEKNGISFLYAHNSGAFQIIDFPSSKRSGMTFEMFDDCIEDIDAFVEYAKELGYKRILLGGHSFGCNKVIYYLHKCNSDKIDNYILISPVDTMDRTSREKEYIEKFEEILKKKGYKDEEIVPILFDEYNFFSVKSFKDYLNNINHQNLPIYNIGSWKQLQSIKINGLYVIGENDGFVNGNAEKHLEIIYTNSKNKYNEYKVIKETGHTYKNKEIELSDIIIEFVNKNV